MVDALAGERLTPIEHVLDLARWAPSGDNTQPWRFEFASPTEAIVHTFDTRRHCVYDLTGGPSQIAVGALLETARIAATGLRMRADIERLDTPSEEKLQFRIRLVDDSSVEPNGLIPCIRTRCTNRKPYSRRALTADEKARLGASVGPEFALRWFEGASRRQIAWLMFKSAAIRLTIPEAYEVHRNVIEWHARTSVSKIPDQAVGLDPIGLALMRWAMKSWDRTRILGTYFGGTLLPRIQLELLPGLGCAAHAVVIAQSAPSNVDDWLNAGRAVQRLLLTVEKLGLQHQPEMTPLIFAGYSRTGRRFTGNPKALTCAADVQHRISAILGAADAQRAVWMGRIGFGRTPLARSLRLPLSGLTHS